MSFDFIQWWHDLIDHLFKHPAAQPHVVAQQVAAVAGTVAVSPVATNVAPQATPSAPQGNPLLDSYLHSGGNAHTAAGQASAAAAVAAEGTTYDGPLANFGQYRRFVGSGSVDVTFAGDCALAFAGQTGVDPGDVLVSTSNGVTDRVTVVVQGNKLVNIVGPCSVTTSCTNAGGAYIVQLRQREG